MEAARNFPLPGSGHGQPFHAPSRMFCLGLAAGWALLGAAACATTFAISTIPGPLPDGRSISFVLEAAEALLAVAMVPLCMLIPVPLLIAGRKYLRRSAHARQRWVTAWTAAASACIGIEVLFLSRLAFLVGAMATGFPNLPQPSWHALAFAIGFLIVGAAMTYILISPRRTATDILTA